MVEKIVIGKKASGGKGSKKIGRSKKKPAHARYNNENRRDKNKDKKAAKIKKMLAAKAIRKQRKLEATGRS